MHVCMCCCSCNGMACSTSRSVEIGELGSYEGKMFGIDSVVFYVPKHCVTTGGGTATRQRAFIIRRYYCSDLFVRFSHVDFTFLVAFPLIHCTVVNATRISLFLPAAR